MREAKLLFLSFIQGVSDLFLVPQNQVENNINIGLFAKCLFSLFLFYAKPLTKYRIDQRE